MNRGDIVSYPKKYLPKWGYPDAEGVVYGVCFERAGSGIEFMENIGGHNGGCDYLKEYNCWFCDKEKIEIIEEAG